MTLLRPTGSAGYASAVGALFVLGACQRSAPPSSDPTGTASAGPAPASAAVAPRSTVTSSPASAEGAAPLADAPTGDDRCRRDEDCVVPLRRTCCGDCPQTPPFYATTRAAGERARDELERRCAAEEHDCDKARCAELPRGCTASAFCEAGRCQARASAGCTH